MLIEVNGVIVDEMIKDSNNVVFVIDKERVVYNRKELIANPKIFESSVGPLHWIVIYHIRIYSPQTVYLLAGSGLIDRKRVYFLDNMVKLGYGTYGYIYTYPEWTTVIKMFKEEFSFIVELAAYSLIKKVFGNVPNCYLPIFLEYCDGVIVLPKYDRVIKYNESKETYREIAKALYNLHSLGLVHRDVKQANIMKDIKGKTFLIDFGLTSWLSFNSDVNKNSSIQTMWYRAPEIAFDKFARYTSAIDCWSFGILLASKRFALFTPQTNVELKKCISDLYSYKRYPHTYSQLPKIHYGEAQEFLNSFAEDRKTVAEYLGLPRIEGVNAPVSTGGFPRPRNWHLSLLPRVHSIFGYFAAVEYLSKSSDMNACVYVANVLFGNNDLFIGDLTDFLKDINCCLYSLNTFFILTVKYPKRVLEFVKPCFILSIGGPCSHLEQADWVEKTFLNEIRGATNPEITKRYNKLKSLYKENNDYNELISKIVPR